MVVLLDKSSSKKYKYSATFSLQQRPEATNFSRIRGEKRLGPIQTLLIFKKIADLLILKLFKTSRAECLVRVNNRRHLVRALGHRRRNLKQQSESFYSAALTQIDSDSASEMLLSWQRGGGLTKKWNECTYELNYSDLTVNVLLTWNQKCKNRCWFLWTDRSNKIWRSQE